MLAIVTQWVAFMDRYVGLVLIGSGALWLVFDRGFPTFSQRLRNGLVFFAGSVVVPGAWILRNQIVVGSPFGIRDTPIATYKTNAIDAITSVGQYIHGYSALRALHRAGAPGDLGTCSRAVASGALVLLRRALVARRARLGAEAAPLGPGDLLGHRVGLLVIYAGAHWAYMIYSASTIAFDPVNTRYLVPMFVPTLMVALVLDRQGCLRAAGDADRPRRLGREAGAASAWWPSWWCSSASVPCGCRRATGPTWPSGTTARRRSASRTRRCSTRSPTTAGCSPTSPSSRTSPASRPSAARASRSSPAPTVRPTWPTCTGRSTRTATRSCLIWVDDDASDVFDHPSYQYPLSTFEEQFELEQVAGDDDVAVYRIHLDDLTRNRHAEPALRAGEPGVILDRSVDGPGGPGSVLHGPDASEGPLLVADRRGDFVACVVSPLL